jgi:DNA-binding transcriptional LysR family regulator
MIRRDSSGDLKYRVGVAELDPPLPALTVPQLSYLVVASSAATFAEAAALLGVTTSALSQGLAELERRLGVDLFERVGRRQVLRPEAAEVVAYAHRVVADTRDLARWAADARAGTTGRLRVGMIDAAAVAHFPAQLRAFRRDQPDVELRLVVAPSGELLDQLRIGALDLAVVVEPPAVSSTLELVGLLEEPLVVVAPEGREAGSAAEWGPWVLFPRGSHTRSLIEAELRAAGAPVEVVAESHQPEVLREMARLGVGWTVLPEAQAGGRSRRGRAPTKGVGPILTTRRLVIARRAGRVELPAADRFVAALLA